jgi:hypothetical protein
MTSSTATPHDATNAPDDSAKLSQSPPLDSQQKQQQTATKQTKRTLAQTNVKKKTVCDITRQRP